MTPTFRLERVDPEVGRIFSGDRIVAHAVWTDSFWCITGTDRNGVLASFTDLNDPAEMGDAYLRAIADGGPLATQSAEWDFFLDPPTFVGPSDGERKCWIYIAWKLVTEGSSVDFREWERSDFAKANAMYRRAVRKYGDNPPDKSAALKGAMSEKGLLKP